MRTPSYNLAKSISLTQYTMCKYFELSEILNNMDIEENYFEQAWI